MLGDFSRFYCRRRAFFKINYFPEIILGTLSKISVSLDPDLD